MRLKIIFPIIAILILTVSFMGCSKNDDTILKPIVTSTSPLNNGQGVERNAIVTATFSMEMAPATINSSTFTLKQGTTIIPGSVEYVGSIATFIPLGTLGASTNYTATITTGAKSLSGQNLETNHTWNFSTGGNQNGVSLVPLGTAANYVILAKTAVNNIPTSAITGDIGLSPAATSFIAGFALTSETGYSTSSQVNGKIYAADMANPTPTDLTTAVVNMTNAYNNAAGRLLPDFVELGAGGIGGLTLNPGLYKWTSTVNVSSDVTIYGNSTDVWIFQIAGNLSVSTEKRIILSGGAKAENIFWQVAGQATLGTTSHFEGVILSQTGITLQTGASLNGRALSQTAVVLDGNVVSQP